MTAGSQLVIVVVTFNSSKLLPGLLESLPLGVGRLSWRLVVADNSSSDDTTAVLKKLAPNVMVVEMGRNAGYAAGINAAVAAAEPHEAILVLNPDVRLGPGCAEKLFHAVQCGGAGIAVPRLTDAKGQLILSLRREPTVLRTLGDAFVGAVRAGRHSAFGEVVSHPLAYAHETQADWAEGSTQMVSASCWTACGGWNEEFFLYSEETDFDLRARDLGFATIFVPDANAIHLEGGSAGSPKLWALLVTNRVRLFRLRHGPLKTGLFWAAVTLREASRAVLGRPTNKAALKALIDLRLLDRKPSEAMVS